MMGCGLSVLQTLKLKTASRFLGGLPALSLTALCEIAVVGLETGNANNKLD